MAIATGETITAADVNALMPSGAIIMWSGTIVNIPSGFVICDGNNSTPNLLGRFVEGVATAATNPGTTGGATSKTTSGHQHITDATASGGANVASAYAASFGTSGTVHSYYNSASTTASFGRTLTDSKTDSITDIRPLYYDIAFIMKT